MKQNTKERILKYSEQLMLSKGYNGFSFMDIAKMVGIKKASIHYHFPTKEDLAVTIVMKYRKLFSRWRNRVEERSTVDKISGFFSLYHSLYRKGNQICPIGMLLAEYSTIPQLLQNEIKTLLEEEKKWLISTMNSAKASGDIPDNIDSLVFTDLVISYLSGAIKFWRIYNDDESYYSAKEYFVNQLK